jgi:hypothetical protein
MIFVRMKSDFASLETQCDLYRKSDEGLIFIRSYIAEGIVPGDNLAFDQHRVILNDSFNIDDVDAFGRYGIIELSSSHSPHCIYLTGGKGQAVLADESAAGLLRLNKDDHRHLVFLLRRDDGLYAEIDAEDNPGIAVQAASATASLLRTRLSQIVATSVVAGSPFILQSTAAAQCAPPPNTPNGSVSGSNYSGINGSYIANQEGRSLTGNIPAGGSSGVTFNGLDLGQQSAQSLQHLGLSQSFINQYSAFIGLTGSRATSAWNANPGLHTITASQQSDIYAQVYPVYYSAAATSFNEKAAQAGVAFQFSQMTPQWQTVVASMYFQAAPSTPGTGSKFMNTQFASQIINQQFSAAMQNLQNFGSPSAAQNIRALQNYNYLNGQNCNGP